MGSFSSESSEFVVGLIFGFVVRLFGFGVRRDGRIIQERRLRQIAQRLALLLAVLAEFHETPVDRPLHPLLVAAVTLDRAVVGVERHCQTHVGGHRRLLERQAQVKSFADLLHVVAAELLGALEAAGPLVEFRPHGP